MIRPFCDEAKLIRGACIRAVPFGPVFSSQVRSFMWVASFWLSIRVVFGMFRCSVLKNPSWLEKVYRFGCFLGWSVEVWLVTSKARASPMRVIISARVFIEGGMVIVVVLVGRTVVVINKPAKRVPMVSRRIGLIKVLLFSLIGAIGRCCGEFI